MDAWLKNTYKSGDVYCLLALLLQAGRQAGTHTDLLT
jgi:hypothetical protein